MCRSKRGVSGRGYRATSAPGSYFVPAYRTVCHINDHRMTRSPVSSTGPAAHCGSARQGTGTFRPKAPAGEPGYAAAGPALPANRRQSPLGRGTNKSRAALPPGDPRWAAGPRARPAGRAALSPGQTQLVATATALRVPRDAIRVQRSHDP